MSFTNFYYYDRMQLLCKKIKNMKGALMKQAMNVMASTGEVLSSAFISMEGY